MRANRDWPNALARVQLGAGVKPLGFALVAQNVRADVRNKLKKRRDPFRRGTQ